MKEDRYYLRVYGSHTHSLGRWGVVRMEGKRESERGITSSMEVSVNTVGGRGSGIRNRVAYEYNFRCPEGTKRPAVDRCIQSRTFTEPILRASAMDTEPIRCNVPFITNAVDAYLWKRVEVRT